MYKIMIVEDELIAATYLRTILENQGWKVVDIVDNADDAIKSLKQYKPDLILMDIMINGPKSGCEVAIDIKKICNCSIIFTTAYADQEMINYAMEVKADGYLVKPYNEKEIIANIAILSAKKNLHNNNAQLTSIFGDFTYINETSLLYKNGEIVKLGPKSLEFIRILCSNKNNYVSYEKIYEQIWGGELNLKKLQMVAYRIREICQVDFLENVNGVGYQIKLDHSF